MLFNSSAFVVLLLVTFAVYYTPFFSRFQLQVLIVSSLVFYACSQPGLLILLLSSALINIFFSYYVAYGQPSRRRLYATLGVAINLAILVFFKYSPLFATTFLNTQYGLGHMLTIIPLPIGISFYTFEGISLLIDVYSNRHKDVLVIEGSLVKHFYKTLFFISFFPHLISGPILKAYQVYPQIGKKKIGDIDWEFVVKHLIMGYFLKMVIADNLSQFTSQIEFPYFQLFSNKLLVALMFSYSFQIFADFAGYSLIAVGLAKLFGYTFMENFNFPYISASFSEFWRRWHISLSTFLKEYLYIPLGGNRKGKFRTYVNLMVTMILGGLWHGAAWSYAVWGFFHGALLATERFVTNNIKSPGARGWLIKFMMMGFVFLLVSVGWILFKLPFIHVIYYFACIVRNRGYATDMHPLHIMLLYALPVIIYHLAYLACANPVINKWFQKTQFIFYGALLFMIAVNSGPSGSFIYFQF